MPFNGWFCGCVRLSCTRNLTNVGAWWFEIENAETEWDPVIFMKLLNDSRPKLQQTLDKSSIFLYACRDHSTVIVPAGQVTIKGFLKKTMPSVPCSAQRRAAYKMNELVQICKTLQGASQACIWGSAGLEECSVFLSFPFSLDWLKFECLRRSHCLIHTNYSALQ